MTPAFWYRTDDGGHRATPWWTLHRDRGDGLSVCGLVFRGKGDLDEHLTPQGHRRECRRCRRGHDTEKS